MGVEVGRRSGSSVSAATGVASSRGCRCRERDLDWCRCGDGNRGWWRRWGRCGSGRWHGRCRRRCWRGSRRRLGNWGRCGRCRRCGRRRRRRGNRWCRRRRCTRGGLVCYDRRADITGGGVLRRDIWRCWRQRRRRLNDRLCRSEECLQLGNRRHLTEIDRQASLVDRDHDHRRIGWHAKCAGSWRAHRFVGDGLGRRCRGANRLLCDADRGHQSEYCSR